MWLISTRFFPSFARQVFPCWDEPAIKATFKLSLQHNFKHTALSNTQSKNITHVDDGSNQNRVWTSFETTPPMSAQLIAFIIGDLEYLSSSDEETLKVWTGKNSVGRVGNLLEFGKKALDILENYTSILYKDHGCKKLDLVIVPTLGRDLITVANWGLIFLNESQFFFDHKLSNIEEEDIFRFVASELSYQWFGSLVTCESWQYSWLTEGLDAYFSYFINDQIHRSWHVMDTFLVDRESMYIFDSQGFIPSLNSSVNSFDVYSFEYFKSNYIKAVFIIRMIKNILGGENFRIGIRNYLKHNKFQAVTSDNFNDEMVQVSGKMNKSLEQALINWENTSGYPLVTISRNYSTNTAKITQSRFMLNHALNSTDRYWIALNFAFEDQPDFDNTSITHWFDPSTTSLDVSAPEENKWLICNKQQFGYYRVNYDEKNWKLIINFLNFTQHDKIHYLNRAKLIDDAFALAESNYIPYAIPFELTDYLEQEINYVPWAVFWGHMDHLYFESGLRYSSYYENFKKNVVNLFSKVEKSVVYDTISHDIFNKKSIKMMLLTMTCAFGSDICKDYTLAMLSTWLADSKNNVLPENIHPDILCGGLRFAHEKIWNIVLSKYSRSKDDKILVSFGCTSNYTLLHNIMFDTMNVIKNVSNDELWNLLTSIISKSDIGVGAILDFVENYKTSINYTDSRYPFIRAAIILVSYYIRTENDFERWREIIPKIVGQEKAEEYINNIQDNIKPYLLQFHSMENYFTKKYNSDN
ncbi:aminopeptidase N-like isoform X2 [Cotesia typhae]|uniref:aminopeptidase N-like isoform X2 n=1 Tax=Cotesia typhae TaxID=2053667 RepID=UPI003D68D037